ncbi:MAG: aspartate aminotransferase family protein [Smithellaceae bacterium]|nr:aspartate aminotransferase family protein [Smithellaceae bacterium]
MTTEELLALGEKNIMATYKRLPVVFVKGAGSRLWDSEGKSYLDFVAGIAVCNLGHCHSAVVQAVKKQAENLFHVSNLYHIEPQIRLAQVLVEHSFADKVFFCNSGAEANEAAIKLARKFAHENMGNCRYELITMENSFHGRTMATITATGQEKFHKGFSPLLEGFRYVPFDDLAALEAAVTDKTCGVLVEPIQAEGGIRLPHEDYLKGVRDICDRKGILMILDEVQVGMGRIGRLFAYEEYGVTPDIMTLAKALGNGFPIGAMLATDRVAAAFQPGSHASTFGGNPLATSAALATLGVMTESGIMENCRKRGQYFLSCLGELATKHRGIVRDVRGKGLMIGMELTLDGTGIVKSLMERGVLINCVGERVLRFVPPLIVTEGEIDEVVNILDEVLSLL